VLIRFLEEDVRPFVLLTSSPVLLLHTHVYLRRPLITHKPATVNSLHAILFSGKGGIELGLHLKPTCSAERSALFFHLSYHNMKAHTL
jgi:hypothetical protein